MFFYLFKIFSIHKMLFFSKIKHSNSVYFENLRHLKDVGYR